jgi:predicted kinase
MRSLLAGLDARSHRPLARARAAYSRSKTIGTWPEATLDTLQTLVAERTGRADIRLTVPSWVSMWRYNLRAVGLAFPQP